jgi:hypothetical protein
LDFNAYEECLQESRMREIRTSGLTRGSNGIGASRPLLSTLLGFVVSISVFRVKGFPHSGIVRLTGFRTAQMAIAIHYVVTRYQHELLAGAIITVDPERIRIRAS